MESENDKALFQMQPVIVVTDAFGQKHTQRVGPRESTLVGSGDIYTMEGHFQEYYHHRVPPNNNRTGWRINLTFRWLNKGLHC